MDDDPPVIALGSRHYGKDGLNLLAHAVDEIILAAEAGRFVAPQLCPKGINVDVWAFGGNEASWETRV
jgi:hypothetical protein